MVKFEETQQISKSISLSLAILSVVFLSFTVYQYEVFILGAIICFVFSLILFMLRLDVKVYDDRAEYKLLPIHKSYRVVMLNSIVKTDTIKPSRLGIFGIKIKNTSSGTFYYLGGNTIMRITTIDGKNLYIGTRKIEEMENVLKMQSDQI